jgi:hypothetical protein
MNAERLHAIVVSVQRDLKNNEILGLFQGLINALSNQISQPAQPQYQQETSTSLEVLVQSLSDSEVNSFSPVWKQTLGEIGGDPILGINLADSIEEILARNQITPAVALSELQSFLARLAEFSAAIDRLVAAFETLGIGAEDLDPSECEVGVLVPRSYVDNELGEFANELKELNRVFGVFAEISTGSRPGFKIKTLSSSDLTVFLEAAPVVAACIAHGVERLVELYKKLLEIRRLQADLANQGVPKKNLTGIEEHAKGVMEKGIEAIIKELMRDFKSTVDPGRKNELTVELRLALNKISNRIDSGYNIEVRMQAPAGLTESANESNEVEQKLATKYYNDIRSAAKNMQFLKLDGEPILHLPEEAKGETGES